jgi:DNA-binding MarR family transcriptional regulator
MGLPSRPEPAGDSKTKAISMAAKKNHEAAVPLADGGNGVTEPAQLARYIGYAIRRAQIRVEESFHAALGALHVTPTRFTLLLLIRENPGIRSVDLARAVNMARSGLVGLIDGFERQALIVRETSRSDRRNQAIYLTELGRRSLRAIERAVEVHEARIAADLSPAERADLLDTLSRLGR